MQELINLIVSLVNFLGSVIYKSSCLIIDFILNFSNYLNDFLVYSSNLVLDIFPSTPEQYTLGFILTEMSETNTVGWWIVSEFIEGFAVVFGVVLVVKAIKLYLPFF